MAAPKYIHMERITDTTFRLMVLTDAVGVGMFLEWLKGRELTLCEYAIEEGKTITKTNLVDELVSK